jgi:hypothetical protein
VGRNPVHDGGPAGGQSREEIGRLLFGDPTVGHHGDTRPSRPELAGGDALAQQVDQRGSGKRSCLGIEVHDEAGSGGGGETERADAVEHRVGARESADGHGRRSYESATPL